MSNPFDEIKRQVGLWTHANPLNAPDGAMLLADEAEILREDMVTRRRGYTDMSTNLPDFRPEQLLSIGGVLYLNLDSGLWYWTGTTWLRKLGALGGRAASPVGSTYSAGKLYYTNFHAIMELDLSTGVLRLLAGKQWISGTSNGTGAAATFNQPVGIATDGIGNLYVCDTANAAIRKVVISTGVVTTFAGVIGAPGVADGTGAAAAFSAPSGICFDGTDFYITDFSTIRRMTTGAAVSTFAGTAGAPAATDGTGAAARFNIPSAITYLSGALYLVDQSVAIVRKCTVPGAVVTTIAGALGGGIATYVSGIAALGADLYVADKYLLRKLVLPGTYSTFAGTGVAGSADGVGTAASFNGASGVTSDGTNLYVMDYSNNTIRKVYVGTGYVTTISGFSSAAAVSAPAQADGIVTGPT